MPSKLSFWVVSKICRFFSSRMKESWPLYRLQLYTFPFIRSYTLHYHTSHLTLFFTHSNLLAYTSSRLFHTLYCSVQTVDSKYFKILILHLLYFCSFIVASPFHLYLSLTHTCILSCCRWPSCLFFPGAYFNFSSFTSTWSPYPHCRP